MHPQPTGSAAGPTTTTDRAIDAVTQLVNEIRVKERLIGQITYAVTRLDASSSGAVNEIKRLLGVTVAGSSAAVGAGGSSPDGDGTPTHPTPSPARHAAPSSPGNGVPGTHLALAALHAADPRPVSPAGPVADWVPTTHHYGPGDVIPTTDPALADTPTVDGAR